MRWPKGPLGLNVDFNLVFTLAVTFLGCVSIRYDILMTIL